MARLATINAHKNGWYAARPNHHKLPPLLLKSLKGADGWGSLCGPAIKAAATRGSAPWLKALCIAFFTSGSELDHTVLVLSLSLARFYEILYSQGRFLTDAALVELGTVTRRMGTAYQQLRNMSREAGLLHFKITPKVHKVQHIPFLSACINPRFVQNYCEESLIGTCCKIWHRSVSGRYQAHVQRNTLRKKLVGLLLRLEE